MIEAINPTSSAAGGVGQLGMIGSSTGTAASSVVGASLPADFSELLSNMAAKAVDTMKTGEAMSIAGVKGQVPVQDVVEAVMAAERTLQTAIAIRDKAVSAYLELSRMSI